MRCSGISVASPGNHEHDPRSDIDPRKHVLDPEIVTMLDNLHQCSTFTAESKLARRNANANQPSCNLIRRSHQHAQLSNYSNRIPTTN